MKAQKICLFLVALAFVLCAFGQESLPSKRGDLRISAYAPPVIPHRVQEGAPCLECHATNDGGIPVMPHTEITNCKQCHVPQGDVPLFRKNLFVGIPEPGKAKRPYSGSPPVMPHRYFMREKCLACHARDSRSDIIHTPHPERTNCRQCHVRQVLDDREIKGIVPRNSGKEANQHRDT